LKTFWWRSRYPVCFSRLGEKYLSLPHPPLHLPTRHPDTHRNLTRRVPPLHNESHIIPFSTEKINRHLFPNTLSGRFPLARLRFFPELKRQFMNPSFYSGFAGKKALPPSAVSPSPPPHSIFIFLLFPFCPKKYWSEISSPETLSDPPPPPLTPSPMFLAWTTTAPRWFFSPHSQIFGSQVHAFSLSNRLLPWCTLLAYPSLSHPPPLADFQLHCKIVLFPHH